MQDESVRENGMAAISYPTILADPPWCYEDKSMNMGGAERHYRTMPTMQIKQYIPELIAEKKIEVASHAWLFLWATNPLLPEALDVMGAWGFYYVGNAVWVKPRMGMGHYFRSAHEILLLGKKGSPRWKFKAQPSWLFAARQDHSHKPEEIYDIIERCVNGPYLELFARRQRQGWDALGDECRKPRLYQPDILDDL